MKVQLVALLLLSGASTLAAQQTLPPAEAMKAMSPEERAKAQRELNAAAAIFYDGPIDSVKAQLRRVLVVMRDSMLAVEAESARLQRTSSPTVAAATARRLAGRCAAAGRTAEVTRVKVLPLETSAELGNEVLKRYRGALVAVGRSMSACENELAGTPTTLRRTTTAAEASATSQQYEMASDALLRALEIPLRPKGVARGG